MSRTFQPQLCALYHLLQQSCESKNSSACEMEKSGKSGWAVGVRLACHSVSSCAHKASAGSPAAPEWATLSAAMCGGHGEQCVHCRWMRGNWAARQRKRRARWAVQPLLRRCAAAGAQRQIQTRPRARLAERLTKSSKLAHQRRFHWEMQRNALFPMVTKKVSLG